MISSKLAISLMFLILFLSIFMANLMNLIATDHNFYSEDAELGEIFTKELEEKYGPIGDSPRNIVWFLQISDIHISIFRDSSRISQFQQFCDSTVRKIKPLLVLATGDLTDAKAKDNLGSSQVKTEWVYYHNIIQESGITEETVWLDIRGNHDNFNIQEINSQNNYFRNFSVQGKLHPKSYIHIQESNGVKVAFVGIDACPEPGLRRPFNFIGVLDAAEQEKLRELQTEATLNADHIVWFGHYPTSCILTLQTGSESFQLRRTIGSSPKSQVYVCGHLHSMGGLVTDMYTKQKNGFLELELGDWKDNRMYRLMVIDHGLFSFVDQKHNHWPLIVVTNPKHARYAMQGREPLRLTKSSSHIRMLVFSDSQIIQVLVSRDNVTWTECRHVSGPLYVSEWTPDLYNIGLQTLFVKANDENGNEGIAEHIFSQDGTMVNFSIKARILLMLEAGIVFQAIFVVLLLTNVVPLLIFRLQRNPPKMNTRSYPRRLIKRLWLLSKIDILFYPIIIYALYLPLGPWAIGELIDGYIGAIFAWGIYIKGAFIPEPFTYMYGSVQIMFVQIPLTLVLAHCLERRLYLIQSRGLKRLLVNLPFVILLSIQMLLAYFFWLEYGTLTFIVGPLRTWSVAISVFLWYKTWTLPPDYCRKITSLGEVPA